MKPFRTQPLKRRVKKLAHGAKVGVICVSKPKDGVLHLRQPFRISFLTDRAPKALSVRRGVPLSGRGDYHHDYSLLR